MRIWGELVFIVVLVVIIAVVVSRLVFTNMPTQVSKRPKKLQPAEWVATDYTLGNETIVIVELRRPKAKESSDFDVLETREIGRITNGLQNYEQLYYDNMQEAYNRAIMLNAFRH